MEKEPTFQELVNTPRRMSTDGIRFGFIQDQPVPFQWETCDNPAQLRDHIRHLMTLAYDTVEANNIPIHKNENPIIAMGRYLCRLSNNEDTQS